MMHFLQRTRGTLDWTIAGDTGDHMEFPFVNGTRKSRMMRRHGNRARWKMTEEVFPISAKERTALTVTRDSSGAKLNDIPPLAAGQRSTKQTDSVMGY